MTAALLSDRHLRSRQVHLDFHTGPLIPDVGVEFDARAFAATLKTAHVNSITLFAKCHHGLLYYDTKRPERHPGLKPGLDLLGEQIQACKSAGIRTPIYLSVQCDEYAANLHPEWLALKPDGTRVGRSPLGVEFAGWQILDMSSPYSDFLADQIEEVVRRYKPVDGIFLDMCWDQPSVSNYAKAGMITAGLDPMLESDRDKFANQVVHQYMERYNRLVKETNGSTMPRVWYNSRPKIHLAREAKYVQHIEIEALPTGGWGYTYFPLNVRWARNFGLPYLGMTARFHKSWSDFGGYKPPAALKYEVSQMLAHGAACSIGDQLHPRGRLDVEAYRRIGDAFAHVESVEPWCTGATPITEVAVLREAKGAYHLAPGDPLEGIVRLLQQLHIQFDIVPPDADLARFKVVVVPNTINLSHSVGQTLTDYINHGGKLFLAGSDVASSASESLQRSVGIAEIIPPTPGMKTVYFRYDTNLIPDGEQSDVVCYDGTHGLKPAGGATSPAAIIESYFERRWDHFCGHGQTPPATTLPYGPAVISDNGAVTGFDIFQAFAEHGQEHLARLVKFIFSRLFPAPLIKSNLPSHVETTVTQHGNAKIVHVLSYAPQRRAPTLDIVQEPTPLLNRKLSLRLPVVPTSVTRQPANESLSFEYFDGYATVCITSEAGHDLIVFE